MQGNNILEQSHKQILQLKRDLTTSSITIDFTKLDDRTQKTIREVLHDSLEERRRKLEEILVGTQKYI